jgi:uncharacterized protein (TIGR03435 family)
MALSLTLLLSAAFAAQDPRFEVVSIRPVQPGAPVVMRSQGFTPILPGGQYVHSRASLWDMIGFAYDVKNPSRQLVGLPKWAIEQSFLVAAKPAPDFPALPAAENREQVRLMLRAMLAERFQLRIHSETRQEAIFALKQGKGGIKLRAVDPPVPPEKEGNVNMVLGNFLVRIIAKKGTMAGLAGALTIFVGRTVVDQTDLHGYYDFDINWNAPESQGAQVSEKFGPEGIALLISVVRNEFGLQFISTKGLLPYWIVDDVKQPTEN